MESPNLEAIIQKYLDGDRGPAVLARLNAAAWECFHDPWEVQPENDLAILEALEVLEELELPEPPPVRAPRGRRPGDAGVQHLAELLTAYLEVHRWTFTRDETFAFHTTPSFRGMEGRDLTLRLAPDGPRPRILRFEMASSWPVPQAARAEARAFCETWNRSGRSLVSHLEMPAPTLFEPGTGALKLRADYALPERVTLKELVAFLDGCVVNGRDFWALARQAAEGWAK